MVNELDRLHREKRKAESNCQWKEAATLCNYIGVELCKTGRFEEALESHKEELEYSNITGNELDKAVANRRIGECYSELGRFKDALKHHKIFLKLAIQQSSKVEEQRAWATLGRTYYLRYLNEVNEDISKVASEATLSKAEQSFLKALELADCLKSQISAKEYAEMRSRLLLNIGLLYVHRGDLSKCAESVCHAIFLTKKFNLYEDLYRCQYSLASVYQRCERYNLALRLLDESISTAKLLHDKGQICEAMVAKANVLLCLKDFEGVKTYLKKAYKLHSPVAIDHEKTEKQLKIAINICNCEKKLLHTKDLSERKLLFEKIADGLASFECFKLAIQYYFSCLKCLNEMNVSEEEKAPIYFSLAQTYSDDNQYEEAIKYFKVEIECNRNKPEEQIKTLWKIAEVKEEQSENAEEVYLQALKLSEETHNKYHIIRSLKKLRSYYDCTLESIKSNKIDQKLSNLDCDNVDDSSDEEPHSEQMLDEINLSDLTDSTDSDAESEVRDVRRKRRIKRPEEKRNELGETPLHRACISGNFKLVKHLVETGHPINARDNCGWLPLHEACNHGYCEIVEYLLGKGAWINDRGGEKCDGITPLHDAASCGNIEVMELLLSKGASVSILNNNKETPLDSFLKWWARNQGDLDSELADSCNEMKNKLKMRMKKAGQITDHSPEEVDESGPSFMSIDQSDELTRADKRIHSSSSSNASDDEDIQYENPHLNRDDFFNDCEPVQSQYKAVISSFRRSAVNAPEVKKQEHSDQKPSSALVDENEVVDDWLIQDTGVKTFKPTRKRKPRKIQKLDIRKNNHSIANFLKEKDSDNDSVPSPGMPSDHEVNEVAKSSSTISINAESLPCPSVSSHHSSSHSNIFCLRVQISDKMILVPISENTLTISWLAEEAAQRYYNLMGSRPHLSLMNKDGALLSPTDLIKNVLQNNEKVITTVEFWDQTSPSERYRQYCSKNGVQVSEVVSNKFLAFETTTELDFSNYSLPHTQTTAILTCLSHYKTLSNLNLSNIDVNDHHMQIFVSSIPVFESLITLKFSCCGLTSSDIKKISNFLTSHDPKVQYLQKLKHLDLSYNNFGPECSNDFANIINSTSLEVINISSCYITEKFLLNRRLHDHLISKSCLKELDVSNNDLNEVGIAELLSCLPRGSLIKLNLSNCVSSKTSFIDYLCNFMSHDLPFVTELHLCGCYLNDTDVIQLSKYVKYCPKLSFCDLSANPSLSIRSIKKLIEDVDHSHVPLHTLCVLGCFEWDDRSMDILTDILRVKCLTRILVDEIPEAFENLVFDTWKDVWGSKAAYVNNLTCELTVRSICA